MIIVTATGHLGADAVVREKDGRKYISFRMCSTIRRGQVEKSTWISVFYRHSENLLPYLRKGASVFISGEEDVSLYNGKTGAQVDVSVNASTLQLIGSTPQAKTPEPPVAKNEQLFEDNNNDEMPF